MRICFALLLLFVTISSLFFSSNEVFAQSCSGGVSCYQNQCTSTNERCSPLGSRCGPLGAGTCVEVQKSYYPCSFCGPGSYPPVVNSCAIICEELQHISFGCDRTGGGCSAPVYPPPPQPTGDPGEPQPTVQPGWGGCGSCGNCDENPPGSGSHPSGECVTTPEGVCTWDPGTCRYIPPPCSPSCSAPYCGQSDGCSGACSNTDDGAPSTPVFYIPSASGQMIQSDAAGQIIIMWSAPGKAERYNLELHPSTNPADSPVQSYTVTGTSYSFAPTSRYYSARVRAQNTSCGTDTSGV